MNLLYLMCFFFFFSDILIEITSLLMLIYYYIFAEFHRISIKYIGNTHKIHTKRIFKQKISGCLEDNPEILFRNYFVDIL